MEQNRFIQRNKNILRKETLQISEAVDGTTTLVDNNLSKPVKILISEIALAAIFYFGQVFFSAGQSIKTC